MAQDVDAAQAELSAANVVLTKLDQERAELEAQYATLTARVDELKGAESGLMGGLELRTSLRKARALAERLNDLSAELRAAHMARDKAQIALVATYDQTIAVLETELVQAPFQSQAAIIGELEAAQSAREALRRQLGADPFEPVAVPNLGGFLSDDPDEVRAAVDELDDHREQVQRQLSEIDNRIAALDRRQRLLSFSEDAADEASLFSEEVIGTSVRGDKNRTTADASNSTSGVSVGAGENGGSKVTNDGGPQSAPEPSWSGDEANGEYDPAAGFGGAPTDADGLYSDDDSARDGGTVVPPQVVPDTPTTPTVSAPSGSQFIIRNEADPWLLTHDGASAGDGAIGGELQRLEAQKAKLKGTLSNIKQQKGKLERHMKALGVR